MYIPSPVPKGAHTAYILRDEVTPRFKFGMSANPEIRRKKICNEIYGRRSHKKIRTFYSWTCQSYFAALFLEQTAISIVTRFGFEPVRSPDWFEIDSPTMLVVIGIIDELAGSIRTWEAENYVMKHNILSHRYPIYPYRAFLKANSLGERDLKRRILLESGGRFSN